MARFAASVSGQSTLKVQLTAPTLGTNEICAVHASSEVAIGTVSRPQLLRPFAPGIGRPNQYIIQPFVGQGVPVGARDAAQGTAGAPISPAPETLSNSRVVTNFSIEPDMPIRVDPTVQAPITMFIRFDPGKGMVLPSGASVVLYAVSSQLDHTWTGSLEWEES